MQMWVMIKASLTIALASHAIIHPVYPTLLLAI